MPEEGDGLGRYMPCVCASLWTGGDPALALVRRSKVTQHSSLSEDRTSKSCRTSKVTTTQVTLVPSNRKLPSKDSAFGFLTTKECGPSTVAKTWRCCAFRLVPLRIPLRRFESEVRESPHGSWAE